MENRIDVERVMKNVVCELLTQHPFYGHILCQLPRIFTDEVPTLGVGRKGDGALVHLYVNPDYVRHIYEIADVDRAFFHLVEVMKHEIHHLLFKHLFMEQKPDQRAFTAACECAVNSYVNRSKLVAEASEQKPGVFAEDFGLPSRMSTDEYYAAISQQKATNSNQTQKGQKGKQGQNSQSAASAGNGGQNDDKQNQQENSDGGQDKQDGNPKQGKGGGKGKSKQKTENSGNSQGNGDGSHEQTHLDDHSAWKGVKGDEAAKILTEDIVRKAKESAERIGRWGDVPGELREQIDAMLNPEEKKIPWEKVLKDFIASSTQTDLNYSNKHISKRFGTRPGTIKEDRMRLAIGIDTSGSISQKDLEMFFNELYWVSKDEADITVFEADTEIQREYPFRLYDGEIKGGGGTNLEPVFKEASERRFDALIYFTDAEAPKITTDYNIPSIFVVTEGYYGHIKRDKLPYPVNYVFYIKNGEVTVE